MSLSCRICNNSENNKAHLPREMMFGTRDEFEYFECGACGTVQIAEIPDLAKYYPEDYYSFEPTVETETDGSINNRIAAFITSASLFLKRKLISSDGFPAKPHGNFYRRIFDFGCAASSVFNLDANPETKILDFGCGSGKLLNTLNFFDYKNLTGIDAFIKKNISYPNGVKIIKGGFSDLNGIFDLIMFHHSFEHLSYPLETLKEAKKYLDENGVILIRIPLANYAWGKYGVDWVGLDPPRHLFLFTEKSLALLAKNAGFKIEGVVYDSTDMQFWASEQYAKDIPLKNESSFDYGDLQRSMFTAGQIRNWKLEAEKLNRERRGDQACFYLKKA